MFENCSHRSLTKRLVKHVDVGPHRDDGFNFLMTLVASVW